MTTNHFEFASVRKLMADLLQTADRCRLERIAQIDHLLPGMRENLKRAEDTVRTCPAEIAKLEAEKKELEALTPEAAVREMLPEGDRKLLAFRCGACKKTWAFPESLRFCPECRTKLEAVAAEAPAKPTEEPFVPGLPPEELRKVWAEWENIVGDILMFTQDGQKFGSAQFLLADVPWAPVTELDSNERYRPHGATWARVEAMADARIIGDTPQVETTSLAEAATQPTTKPPEDDDPAERAFWRFCMLIDKTQSTTRVKAGYLEGPYTQRDAFKIAVRSTILGAEMPEPPALLDLRELPVGTVCEASDFFPIYNSGRMIHAGDRFRVVELSDGDLPVLIKVSGKDWWSSALVPAIVVEKGGEDAQG